MEKSKIQNQKSKNLKKGVALATVLIMVIGLAGLGLALHFFGRVNIADVLGRADKIQTDYLARTGISDGIWYLNGGGVPKWYSDGGTTYQVHTGSIAEAGGAENRKVGEYNIFSSGVVFSTLATFPADNRIFNTYAVVNDTVYVLIWSGDPGRAALASMSGNAILADGTKAVTLSLNRNYDLDADTAYEGFTATYYVPGILSPALAWQAAVELSYAGSVVYRESNITLQINGVGTPSAKDLRKLKSLGFWPQANPLYLKSCLEARGTLIGTTTYKIKELYE